MPTSAAAAVSLDPMPDTPESFRRLMDWFAVPDIQRYYEGPLDYAAVRAKYGPRTTPRARVRALFVTWGKTPVGYAQAYRLDADDVGRLGLESGRSWGGFDLLIGNPAQWGQGIGQAAVGLLCDRLAAMGATCAAIDTAVDNDRALHCYEASGFIRQRILAGHSRYLNELRDHWLLTRDNLHARPRVNPSTETPEPTGRPAAGQPS